MLSCRMFFSCVALARSQILLCVSQSRHLSLSRSPYVVVVRFHKSLNYFPTGLYVLKTASQACQQRHADDRFRTSLDALVVSAALLGDPTYNDVDGANGCKDDVTAVADRYHDIVSLCSSEFLNDHKDKMEKAEPTWIYPRLRPTLTIEINREIVSPRAGINLCLSPRGEFEVSTVLGQE